MDEFQVFIKQDSTWIGHHRVRALDATSAANQTIERFDHLEEGTDLYVVLVGSAEHFTVSEHRTRRALHDAMWPVGVIGR